METKPVKKSPLKTGITIGFLNIVIVLLISFILTLAYLFNTLTYYPESDNVGMLLVPMLLMFFVLPATTIILLLIEGVTLGKRYGHTFNYVFKSILISIPFSLMNLVIILIMFFVTVGIFASLFYK